MARKGQFKKGGGRVGGGSSHTTHRTKHRKSGGSKSIVVRQPAPIVNVRTSNAPAKRHHTGRRRHGGGGGDLSMNRVAKLAGIGALLGFTVGDGAPKKLEILDKIPDIGKLPKEAVIGGIAYVLRKKHRLLGDIALASLIVAGNKLGRNEFKLSGYYDE